MNLPDPDKLSFVKLGFEGVETLVEWARMEGWNPGLHDASVFYHTDPDGFYGYYNDSEMVAGGSVVSYNDEFGFMGFFIVKPEYRSQGIGRRLWFQRRDILINRLNNEAPIGMDGVVDMQPFYSKGGFNLAFRDERYKVTAGRFTVDSNIYPIVNDDYPEVFKYDQMCFGFNRERFLIRWIEVPDSFAFKYVAGGDIKGFAVIRKAAEGYKTGPLFADDPEVADALFQACMNAVPGEMLYLDIPVINVNAIRLTEKYNGAYVFECARMYYGKAPDLPLDKIYGITTFELG